MKIELTQYQENEDGGADYHVDMDKEAARSLINYALVNMLSKAAEEGKLYTPEFDEAEAEEEEAEDVDYFYDEDEDVEYYYVKHEDTWYYYNEDEDDWLVVDDEEEDEDDDRMWVALDPEQLDLLFVKELKSCLTNSYQNNFVFQEDIDSNIHVRNACKTLLNYFMIPSEADAYLDKIATTYEC